METKEALTILALFGGASSIIFPMLWYINYKGIHGLGLGHSETEILSPEENAKRLNQNSEEAVQRNATENEENKSTYPGLPLNYRPATVQEISEQNTAGGFFKWHPENNSIDVTNEWPKKKE